jgi:hypothetical protein
MASGRCCCWPAPAPARPARSPTVPVTCEEERRLFYVAATRRQLGLTLIALAAGVAPRWQIAVGSRGRIASIVRRAGRGG